MRFLCSLLSLLLLLSAISGCNKKSEPVSIILETDMGNDIDDALALVLLNRYIDEGKAKCLMVGINKTGLQPAMYVDVMNTFYGHGNIPIGVAKNGVQEDNNNNYTSVALLKDENGNNVFSHTIEDYSTLPDAVTLYRKVLSGQPDGSVTIVSVGFSTNLIQLLDSPADEYSSLSGLELVRQKVKLLSVMGGSCDGSGNREYNIVNDVPAAQKLFSIWPSKIVISPWELGVEVNYPASSIENDFNWTAYHPYALAYRAYGNFPYDRPSWDPTSMIYAVEECGPWFVRSSSLDVSILDDGRMILKLNPEGNRYFISSNKEQCDLLVRYLVEMATRHSERK